MQMRPLGHSGLWAAPLAFDGNVFGWTADEAMSFRLLDAFVDAGVKLVDRVPYEAEYEPLVRERGIGVINFFGLARGFPTGKYRSEADLA